MYNPNKHKPVPTMAQIMERLLPGLNDEQRKLVALLREHYEVQQEAVNNALVWFKDYRDAGGDKIGSKHPCFATLNDLARAKHFAEGNL